MRPQGDGAFVRNVDRWPPSYEFQSSSVNCRVVHGLSSVSSHSGDVAAAASRSSRQFVSRDSCASAPGNKQVDYPMRLITRIIDRSKFRMFNENAPLQDEFGMRDPSGAPYPDCGDDSPGGAGVDARAASANTPSITPEEYRRSVTGETGYAASRRMRCVRGQVHRRHGHDDQCLPYHPECNIETAYPLTGYKTDAICYTLPCRVKTGTTGAAFPQVCDRPLLCICGVSLGRAVPIFAARLQTPPPPPFPPSPSPPLAVPPIERARDFAPCAAGGRFFRRRANLVNALLRGPRHDTSSAVSAIRAHGFFLASIQVGHNRDETAYLDVLHPDASFSADSHAKRPRVINAHTCSSN